MPRRSGRIGGHLLFDAQGEVLSFTPRIESLRIWGNSADAAPWIR